MKALILAAGHGSRLRSVSRSKPLTPVAGTPLVEHVVRSAHAAGVRDFIVATGHEAERVEAFLAGLATRLDVAIACARLADWDRPNGHSLVAAARGLDSPFLLLMSDHLFDPEIARRLIRQDAGAGFVLAVDRDIAREGLDLDDATKVETGPEGRIVMIGKALDRYDAIDTGLFLATPALAEAVEAVAAAGKAGGLSEGCQHLADAGHARTLDVTGTWWLDVDDPPSLAQAQAHLHL